MFQNLKVDVIYYKTNTDFEMEFNLCGCCRMRLLTDKSPDRKTVLHSLARAVSRSRIIIVTGNLFGEDGIFNIVSSATGIPLTELEKSNYGIGGNEAIEILKGATPLVTAEGYFGGCIIERGPQTMILISENKNIRKNIMQNLIHPYVEELCAVELKEKAAAVTETGNITENVKIAAEPLENSDEAMNEEIDSDTEVPQTDESMPEDSAPETEAETELSDENSDSNEISQEIDEKADEEHDADSEEKSKFYTDISDAEADAIISSGMIFESDDEDIVITPIEDVEAPLIVDSPPEDSISENIIEINDDYLKDFILESDEEYRNKPKLSFSLNKAILALAILLLILFAVLCFCIFYVPSASGMDVSEYIKETFNTLFGKI